MGEGEEAWEGGEGGSVASPFSPFSPAVALPHERLCPGLAYKLEI